MQPTDDLSMPNRFMMADTASMLHLPSNRRESIHEYGSSQVAGTACRASKVIRLVCSSWAAST
jgi:hypothetical protein